jgi:hypothetical protein
LDGLLLLLEKAEHLVDTMHVCEGKV